MRRLDFEAVALKLLHGYGLESCIERFEFQVGVPQRPERDRIDQKKLCFQAEMKPISIRDVHRNGNPQSTCRFHRQTARLRPPTSQDTACVLIWPGCRGASNA